MSPSEKKPISCAKLHSAKRKRKLEKKKKRKTRWRANFLSCCLEVCATSNNRKDNDSTVIQIINFMLITKFFLLTKNKQLVLSARISKVKVWRHNKCLWRAAREIVKEIRYQAFCLSSTKAIKSLKLQSFWNVFVCSELSYFVYDFHLEGCV